MQRDYPTIASYFQELVREPGVRRAVLALEDGRVKLASDQKLEGRRAGEVFGGISLDGDAPRVEGAGGEILVIVPVMGLTSRLGTVIVGYDPAAAAR
jgi:hypothetical protein